ncbi:hypothetical protein C8Q80DRAFT_78385 [Daedaleopsis nitida]|nr:hypothetical protein C8Q80DRAFT_78385 [Daedaleopsis nitida]
MSSSTRSSASLSPTTTRSVRVRTSPPPLSTHTSTPHISTVTATTHATANAANGASAYITSCSGPVCETPDVVHVVIHTTITIPDFNRYYKTPISSFQPAYVALADGTLISSVYTSHLHVSQGWLVMAGAFGVFFIRNTYRAIQYTRTVKAKNKSLFYMLAVSQAIGVVVSVAIVVTDFAPTLNCTAAGMLKKGGASISTTLLVTGILGTKAYRCLSNAGFVIVILALLRAAIIAVSGIVIVEYKGGRRITGTCETVSESPLLPISIILQFLEACFICVCFLWAVYRSYRSPADHARLSLPLEVEDETSSVGSTEKEEFPHGGPGRRGWWDYVPNTDPEKLTDDGSSSSVHNTRRNMLSRIRRWWSGEPRVPSTVFHRKPSIPGEVPLSQPARMSSVSNAASLRMPTAHENECSRANSPPPPSTMERIIRYVPRADVLRSMLKNELLYTTFITAVLLVIAVVMLVGVTQQFLLGPTSWILFDWVIISMCTMHSFSRVAHRHEREAWLQDPANWRSMPHHAEVEDVSALRPRNSRRAWSPVSVASNWRHRHRSRGESDIPSTFGPNHRSGEFSIPEPFTPTRPSRVRSGSSTRPPEQPSALSRTTSMMSSRIASMESYRHPAPWRGHGSPTILPSPDYPPTGTSTPAWETHTSSAPPTFLQRSPHSPRRSGSPGPLSPTSPPPQQTSRAKNLEPRASEAS